MPEHRRARLVARTVAASVPKSKVQVTAAYGLVVLLGLVACCEVPLRRLSFVEVPSVDSQMEWIDWLKQNTPEDAVIAHLPFPKGPLPKDYESEVWGMYWGLFHHRRMVNGYSGFFPASYLALKSQMQSFPDAASFAALRSHGVTYCVCRQSFLEEHPLSESLSKSGPWEVTLTDRRAGVVILRLHP